MANNFSKCPKTLQKLDHWVNWKKKPDPNNPEKTKKVPINPGTGKLASVTDPSTWSSFEDAVKRNKKGGVDGIGFVFTTEDTYVGIDLDDCRDVDTGEIEPWAQNILADINSYSELSPSGTGIHIIAIGKLPGNGIRFGNKEIYDQGRYFTVTGNSIDTQRSSIKNYTNKINKYYKQLQAEKSAAK